MLRTETDSMVVKLASPIYIKSEFNVPDNAAFAIYHISQELGAGT
jgi:hypothetical protein